MSKPCQSLSYAPNHELDDLSGEFRREYIKSTSPLQQLSQDLKVGHSFEEQVVLRRAV